MADDRELDILLGTLDVLVLKTLSWGRGTATASHGGSESRRAILDGALYTALHRLEERGLVEAEWGYTESGKRAKFYRLTTSGRRELVVEARDWARYAKGVARVLAARPEPT